MRLDNTRVKTARVSNQQAVSKAGLVIIVVILAVVVTIVSQVMLTRQQRQVISVLAFASDMDKGSLVTRESFTTMDMLVAEYEKWGVQTLENGEQKRLILQESDLDNILQKDCYTSYFMKANTPIYTSSLTRESPRKNSYLYEMDGELVKLDVSADVFGDMVVPGDKVNIRCTYTEQSYALPTESQLRAMQEYGEDDFTKLNTQQKSIMLFSEVTILDMLNGNGESIFDYYYDFMNWPTTKQQEALKDSSFKAATAPSQIILCVTAEEVENYIHVQQGGPSYFLTLLPRENNSVILEAINSLNTRSTFVAAE